MLSIPRLLVVHEAVCLKMICSFLLPVPAPGHRLFCSMQVVVVNEGKIFLLQYGKIRDESQDIAVYHETRRHQRNHE